MKAQLWKIKVCNGILEYSHGWQQTILELFINKLNLTINCSNGELHYFKSDGERYKKADLVTSNIDFPKDLALTIAEHLDKEEEMDNQIRILFDSLTKKYKEDPKQYKITTD